MKKQFKFIPVLVMAYSLSYCHKHSDGDTTKPSVTVQLPAPSQVIASGDSVRIKGTASDNENLHEMEMTVTNPATGAVLFTSAPSVHGLVAYDFYAAYKPSVAAATSLTVTIWAEDHDSNRETKTVTVTAMP